MNNCQEKEMKLIPDIIQMCSIPLQPEVCFHTLGTMLNFCYMIVVACSIYHVSSAGKLTRQCKESYGKCGVTTDVSCNRMFGPGWVEKGKCCNSRPCCVEFQCGEIQQIPNGKNDKNWDSYWFYCNFFVVLQKTTFHFNGTTYTIPCRYLYSIDAEDHCKGQGGNLASIETEEENNYLKYVAKLIPGVSYWIGLSDRKTEGSFQWISSQQLTFTDWYQGPPIQPDDKTIYFENTWDADCVLLNQEHSYQWSDETCDQIGAYAICEFWSVLSF
ncbi:CD206 [Mytilus edulis]|uniref:MRC n=1 Tax=Mytilus edulis TaxID=6550 RepID=A0A8S3QRP1_MYTED|nr:CD206 [Mytilus edulis]